MPATFLMNDCDLTGHKSIIDLVEQGIVDARPTRSFDEADRVYWDVYYGRIPMPTIYVVDTITKLADVTRQDVVMDPSQKGVQTIEQMGEKIVTSKREWGIAGDKVNRLLRNIFELPCHSIFVAHEASREDIMSNTEKTTVNAQKMILGNLMTSADAVVRLHNTSLPIESNGFMYPAGSRQLLLAPTADSAVGVRTHLKLPPFLMNPTLSDFITTLGGWQYFPHNTVLYGPPKIGKTTFWSGAQR